MVLAARAHYMPKKLGKEKEVKTVKGDRHGWDLDVQCIIGFLFVNLLGSSGQYIS